MIKRTPDRKLFAAIIIFFILVNTFLIVFRLKLEAWKISQDVAIIGNLILFLVTLLSLYMYRRAMTHANTTGFLMNSYGGVMVKLFVCAISVAVYAFAAGASLNKGAIFLCIFLYFIYTILEMRSLMQWNKERKNG